MNNDIMRSIDAMKSLPAITKMQSMEDILLKVNRPYTAKNIFVQLRDSVVAFEKSLDPEHEVGVRLVSFGADIQFSVIRMGYIDPSLIWFEGILPDGSTTKLMQHTSQLSFLLVALKMAPESKKHAIGFSVSGPAE